MIGDISALKLLKEHRYCIDSLIQRMEKGQRFTSTVISVNSLLRARDCLASARTEEHYISEQDATTELPLQDISRLMDRPDHGFLEKKGWTEVDKKAKDKI
jgi:hypothetical protein